MRLARAPAATALATALVMACTSAGTAPATSPTQTTTAVAGGELDKLRARGTLIVAVRVEAPPANRTTGDPAHGQKRAFETAVATMIATSVLGPSAKVELRSQGGDRLGALDQGADIVMTVDAPAARDRALVSTPYARSGIVLAAKQGGPVRRVEDVAGKALAVAQDELGARELAQSFFQQRGITVTLETAQGVNGALGALVADRVVAIVGDRIGVDLLATERSLAVVTEVAARPYVIATRKNAPDLAGAIDAALRSALASGAVHDAATKAGFPYQAP